MSPAGKERNWRSHKKALSRHPWSVVPSVLQPAASGDGAGAAGLARVQHVHVVLPGAGQYHRFPLRVPPALSALARVPRLPPPQVSFPCDFSGSS